MARITLDGSGIGGDYPVPRLPKTIGAPDNPTLTYPGSPTGFPAPRNPWEPTYTTNTRVGNAPGDTIDVPPITTPPNPVPPVTAPGTGDRTGTPTAHTGGLAPNFTSASTYQDLINFLNSGHLDPTTAQTIVQQYAQAHGLSGSAGNPNGMPWGAYDAQRQKYYIPGYDIRYENGQWVPHAWGDTSGGSQSGTSVFGDPATQQYEQLLNQLISQFMSPVNADSFKSVDDYLKNYFQQLQQPVYSPEQRNVIQTQAMDPISQQRDSVRQQIIQRYANQGIPASSGIVQKAIQDSDMQFEQLRTQAQGQFATQEIAQGKQNQAAAAQLGPAITQYELAPSAYNEQRALQAAQLAGIVPNMAWNRLTGANSILGQTNPNGLLGLLQSFQNQGYNQGSNYGNSLAQLFAILAPLFS